MQIISLGYFLDENNFRLSAENCTLVVAKKNGYDYAISNLFFFAKVRLRREKNLTFMMYEKCCYLDRGKAGSTVVKLEKRGAYIQRWIRVFDLSQFLL